MVSYNQNQFLLMLLLYVQFQKSLKETKNQMRNISNSVCTMKTTTKMYLSVVLSTLCIVFYQYQLSKANFVSLQRNDVIGGTNSILTSDNRNINSKEAKEVRDELYSYVQIIN